MVIFNSYVKLPEGIPNGSQWIPMDPNGTNLTGIAHVSWGIHGSQKGGKTGGMASGCHGWRGECLGYVPEQTISHVKSSRPSAEAAEKGHLQLIPSGKLTF